MCPELARGALARSWCEVVDKCVVYVLSRVHAFLVLII